MQEQRTLLIREAYIVYAMTSLLCVRVNGDMFMVCVWYEKRPRRSSTLLIRDVRDCAGGGALELFETFGPKDMLLLPGRLRSHCLPHFVY